MNLKFIYMKTKRIRLRFKGDDLSTLIKFAQDNNIPIKADSSNTDILYLMREDDIAGYNIEYGEVTIASEALSKNHFKEVERFVKMNRLKCIMNRR